MKRLVWGAALLACSAAALAAPPAAERKAPSPPRVAAVPLSLPDPDRECASAESVLLPRYGVRICLVEQRGWLMLRAEDVSTGRRYPDMVAEYDNVFGMLASTKAAPLWPRLLAFVGEDGEGWRRALRKRADDLLTTGVPRPREGSPLENFVGGSVLITLQAAELYWQAGDAALAIKLLKDKRLELESLGALTNPNLQFSWISLLLRQAKLEINSGDLEGGLYLYRLIAGQKQLDGGFRANGLVNHAAVLAEYDRPREAIVMLDAAEKAAGPRGGWVPGSERQFAWIRACALNQLGDAKGAKKAMAVITKASPTLRRASGGIASTESIELRMAYCMNDDAAIAAMLHSDDSYLYEPAWFAMQDGAISLQPGKDAVRLRARQRLIGSTTVPAVRQLPAALHPALNFWVSRPAETRAVPVPGVVGTKGRR
ncbi:hypothetical protein [Novosphingobium sp.]|uniref:hypothetical protein n=1 Tax=Novosphingobium sp. TaxID=1874826 RepID=UPI00286A8744|nr:hypothetical protein [Novosphingobium sp.]